VRILPEMHNLKKENNMKGFTEVSEKELNEIDGGFWELFAVCVAATCVGVVIGVINHFAS
jgi:lactobin A/cerein 7B family class IIb bacteriocin